MREVSTRMDKNKRELWGKLHKAFIIYNLSQFVVMALLIALIFVCWLLRVLVAGS